MIGLLLSMLAAITVSLLGTPIFIRVQRARGIGQPIREDGPEMHMTKAGTPTMGGVMIVLAAAAGYAAGHLRGGIIYTRAGILVLLLAIGGAVVGGADDFIKVTSKKNEGLNKRQKIAGLAVIATGFSVLAVRYADIPTRISLFRANGIGISLPTPVWVVFAFLVIIGTTNGVNLTDGLDGLAAGCSSFTFSAFAAMGFWMFRHDSLYHVPQGLDLAVLATGVVGGCVGFLWWNAKPAQIIMGDTGAIALGASAAGLALIMNVQLLLPILGGVYVMETVSVMIQVVGFKYFGKRRVFRMAPIHHHFELGKTGKTGEKDLGEVNVVIRFWMVAAALTAVGLGLFYNDYLHQCPGRPNALVGDVAAKPAPAVCSSIPAEGKRIAP